MTSCDQGRFQWARENNALRYASRNDLSNIDSSTMEAMVEKMSESDSDMPSAVLKLNVAVPPDVEL